MKRKPAPRLSLDLLRGFRAAARHLSFTRAAAELCITQSAVSHEVKALEEQLGQPLFSRVNRSLLLTEAGEKLYRAVDDALDSIDSVVTEVAQVEQTLSVTSTVPFASLWLGPRLPEFTRLHPEIGVRLTASNDLLDLRRERIDVAIRHVSAGDDAPSDIKLFDHEMFPVCAPALLRRPGGMIETPADLAHHVLLEFETVRNGRPWYDWHTWLRARRIRALKPAGWQRFSHYDQLIEAALGGSGVAMGRWPALSRHLAQGALVPPLAATEGVVVGALYVIAPHMARHAATQSFVAWLLAEAERDSERRQRNQEAWSKSRAPRKRARA